MKRSKQWWLGLTLLCSIYGSGCGAESSIATISAESCATDPAFVWVPPGQFGRGSDQMERGYGYRISAIAAADDKTSRVDAEQFLRKSGWFDREPQKAKVELPGVCFGRNLVTNQQYQKFIQATGHRSPGISAVDYQRQGFLVHPYAEVKSFLWQGEQFPEGEAEHPVVLVSYEDAMTFAKWQGEQDGNVYRLPTALEWEKAARGTDGRYFPWGNDWRDAGTNWGQDVAKGGGRTSRVGIYPLSRSIYGAEDMAGNVFEYTSTLRQLGRVSVLKGCSWDDSPGFCRAAYEHTRPVASRHILFGFRLVRLK
ncbi:formylglycine-generating enzyme family protein [Romeriopsis navalis]|uniref:formylglycine-generating enzyme family protein n=1 Tax=Romeriopsis navalis TaxID=2992132 RepID=UPI0021F8EC39|nr:formylglycine-generating enzyme family protein [Romeriopsis navalis]